MTTFDVEAVEAARARLPEPATDRPDDVKEALAEREVVGRNCEKPLAGDYGRYPEDPTDILSPEYGDVLREVCQHDAAETPADVSKELGVSEDLVEKAMDLHGMELPHDDGDDGGGERTLTLPLEGDIPLDYVRDPPHEDARVLHHLVVECGMGVEGVVTFLSRQVNEGRPEDQPRYHPSPAEVENALRRHNLMEGTTDTNRGTAREERLEVNRPKEGRHTATTVKADE